MRQKYWYWAQGHCATADFELASYYLFEAGVQSIEELDPNLAAPDHGSTFAKPVLKDNGNVVNFRFYSESDEFCQEIVAKFPQYQWASGQEPAQDWDLWWREKQQAVQVSPQLWVRPPWVEFSSPNPQDTVLIIEAKSAFGTGEHESTALSAELMEKLDLNGQKVLDIGAGTGILAMYALRRGAKHCFFTEIDPLTITPLTENYALNQCGKPQGYLGGLECLTGQNRFDLIVCNMIRSEMWPLRSDILRLLKPEGHLILSGHLAAEQSPVLDWFSTSGLKTTADLIRNEWWAVCARKN